MESSLHPPRSSLHHWPRYDCRWRTARGPTEPSWRVLGKKLHRAREMRLPGGANDAVVSHYWRSSHHRIGSWKTAADWHLLEMRGWATAWEGGQERWMLVGTDHLHHPL